MKNKSFPHYTISPYETFEQLLTVVKSKYGDKVLFRTKRRKREETVTYNQFYDDVQKLASHFNNTYGSRNKIAVIGENSYEWILTYFAVVCSNNIIVPIDKELASADIAELLGDCEATVFVYSKDYDDIADDLDELMPSLACINMKSLNGYIENVTEVQKIVWSTNAKMGK